MCVYAYSVSLYNTTVADDASCKTSLDSELNGLITWQGSVVGMYMYIYILYMHIYIYTSGNSTTQLPYVRLQLRRNVTALGQFIANSLFAGCFSCDITATNAVN